MGLRKTQGGFEIMLRPCNQCLFGRNRIVNAARKNEIIDICREQDKHFICHKARIAGRDVCCYGFYKRFPGQTVVMRVSAMLGLDKFIEEKNLKGKIQCA